MTRTTVKMALVSKITLLLFVFYFVSFTDSRENCDIYGKTGADFLVPLNHELQMKDRLLWKFNGQVIFLRRYKGNGNVTYGPGKKSDVAEKGDLLLTALSKGRAGKYEPEVFDVNGKSVKVFNSTTVCVLDPVLKPNLKAECQSSKVKFTCSVGDQKQQNKDLKITWFQDNKRLTHLDNKISVTLVAKDIETSLFSCNVSNPVSVESSDPVKQTCYESSKFPEKILGLSIWIFVGGGGGIVLVLIIIVIVCCVQARRKRRMNMKDEEELRLGWTATQQQQQQQHHQHRQQHNHSHNPPHPHHHHHQHQHQQPQPAGHTGPRQPRSKQLRPKAPEPPSGHPQPSPRKTAQLPNPPVNGDGEVPPPLPQPRKKGPKTPRA